MMIMIIIAIMMIIKLLTVIHTSIHSRTYIPVSMVTL